MSCAAGIVTLWIALVFLCSEINVSANVRFLSFSLMALNPGLIGINAQATNDSFVILFASPALYSGYHFFEKRRVRDFIGRYGSPFVNSNPPGFFPRAFEKTFVYKPGVISIMDSLWISLFPLGNLASSG